MKPAQFARLCGVMGEFLNGEAEGADNFDGYLYDTLNEDMARAARAVLASCLAGQRFAESQKTSRTGEA